MLLVIDITAKLFVYISGPFPIWRRPFVNVTLVTREVGDKEF